MRLSLPLHAVGRSLRAVCALVAVWLPTLSQAQAQRSTSPALSAVTAPVLRLELPGHVSLRRANVQSASVTATAEVRGYSIGWSDATQRAAYRTETLRIADTLIVRPAPRERLRSVGLTWRYEHFVHELRLPVDATVIVHGASQLHMDGARAARCAGRAWIVAPGAAPRCLAVAQR